MILEEISYKEGKFVNRKGKEVRPEPIGESQIISMNNQSLDESSVWISNYWYRLIEKDKKYNEANVFAKGVSWLDGLNTIQSFNFYKI